MVSIKTVTRVQPGHRVQLVVPELAVGDLVNVVVEPCGKESEGRESILAFLDSLPEGPRAFATWEQYEQHRQQESPWHGQAAREGDSPRPLVHLFLRLALASFDQLLS